jgi:diguanylate cyclase (GGDEF)-like protein
VFRYGGEEFTAVFEGKQRDAVVPLVDEVRKAVAERTFTVRGTGRPRRRPERPRPARRSRRRVTITISAGVADGPRADGDPESVVKAADKALYRAKRAGRNRVRT